MVRKAVVLAIVTVFICGNVFAMCGVCGSGDTVSAGKTKTEAVKVNNAICPVTGEKVDMKNPVTIEYDGKIYNLCCPACIKDFNSDPEKYSAKAK